MMPTCIFGSRTLKPNALHNGVNEGNRPFVHTLNDHVIFDLRFPKLFIDLAESLHLIVNVPPFFTGMDEPIKQRLARLVGPAARVEELARFIQDDDAIVVISTAGEPLPSARMSSAVGQSGKRMIVARECGGSSLSRCIFMFVATRRPALSASRIMPAQNKPLLRTLFAGHSKIGHTAPNRAIATILM